MTWELNRGLWDQPSRPEWGPGAGGLCLHSICPWPGEPDRLAVGISSVGSGSPRTGERPGRSATRGSSRVPAGGDARHRAARAMRPQHAPVTDPTRTPLHAVPRRRLPFRRRGAVVDQHRPGSAERFRLPDGRRSERPRRRLRDPAQLRSGPRLGPGAPPGVRDARRRPSWTGHTEGLPQDDTYLTILRQAFARDDATPLGLWFGATSGELFGSTDAGATWRVVARDLAPVLSVRAA
jgi:hypothetical protein